MLQLANPYNVRLPETTYRISHNFGHDGVTGGIRWKVGTTELEYNWATLLGLPAGSNLLNGLGVGGGNRPWIHYKTAPVALEPGESVIFMPVGDNWSNPVTGDGFNLLARGENSSCGVLRFPIPTPPGTITWEPLNALGVKDGYFRFGENNDPSWTGSARNWTRSGNTTGQQFQVFDYFLGNDIISYYSSGSKNRPWMRDFDPRYPFPSAPDGQPLVNESVDGNPWRNGTA